MLFKLTIFRGTRWGSAAGSAGDAFQLRARANPINGRRHPLVVLFLGKTLSLNDQQAIDMPFRQGREEQVLPRSVSYVYLCQ